MRASGSSRCALANASEATTSALAPSFNPGALPAVTLPPGSNDGFSAASASSDVSLRGPSSFSIALAPSFPGTSTGTISALNRHAAMAATAFWWLARANRSWSTRDTPAFLAVYSARLPMRSEEHTSELQSQSNLVCRLLLEKKKQEKNTVSSANHDSNAFSRDAETLIDLMIC